MIRTTPRYTPTRTFSPLPPLMRYTGDRILDTAVDQLLKASRIAISQPAGIGMVAAPVAGDHIGRNRPGTAGKAEEGNLGRQGVRHPAHGLDDRIETFRTRQIGRASCRERVCRYV